MGLLPNKQLPFYRPGTSFLSRHTSPHRLFIRSNAAAAESAFRSYGRLRYTSRCASDFSVHPVPTASSWSLSYASSLKDAIGEKEWIINGTAALCLERSLYGGRRGIRTLDPVYHGITVFETAAFNHSAILPLCLVLLKINHGAHRENILFQEPTNFYYPSVDSVASYRSPVSHGTFDSRLFTGIESYISKVSQ